MTERRIDRFSQVYLFGGPQLVESNRFRKRIAALYYETVSRQFNAVEYIVATLIQRECGVEVGHGGVSGLFERGEMRDVLDAISLVPRGLVKSGYFGQNAQVRWFSEVARFFREENLAYRVGDDGVVHRFIDEEFHLATAAALQGLSSPLLGPAQSALGRSVSCLTSVHQDTKGAVLAVFEACEIVAKHLIPEAQNLNAKLCKDRLAPLCMSPGAAGAEARVENGVFAAMAEWVNAVHNYRHGQAEPDVVAPTLELAVQLVSMGCSFVRRLAQVYERSAPTVVAKHAEPSRAP